MARSNRQDLYLSVNGDVRGLQAAAKTGRSVLNELGATATSVLEQVEAEFRKVGASGAPAGLKEAERAYSESFRRIGEAARSAANVPTGQAALQILDANATRAAAEAASQKAVALRLVAEAATRADTAQQGQNAAVRAYAVAAATAALEAEGESRALLEQARILGLVETEIGGVINAQNKGRVVSGQARIGYQQLSYQLGDISTQYASGASASIIFAQQSAQVIQAIQLIGGEAKGLLGLLGGPWGIAFTAALVALTPFVGKLFEGGDALEEESRRLEENAGKTSIADQAKKLFLQTEAGAIDDVRALTEELDRQNDSLKTNAERLNVRAKLRLETLGDVRSEVAGNLAEARTGLSVLQQPGARQERGAGVAISNAERQVVALEARLGRIDRAIADANAARLRTQKDLAEEAAKRATDPLAQITRRYEGADGLIEQAKKRATAEETVNGVLTRQLTTLKQQQKAKTEAAQKRASDAKKTGMSDRQFGREIGVDDATRIIAGIGGRVTSGLRSTDRQAQLYADKLAGRHDGPVAKPGTSAHERGGAIDVAFGPGISVASIKKAFADEGVALRAILRERGQRVYHVEFGKAGPSGATTARRQEAEADRRTQNADAYASLLSQAKEQQLRLERGRVTSISALADLDVEAVRREQADRDRMVQKGVQLGRWTQAQAEAVKTINASNAEAEIALIRERERKESTTKRAELERDALDDQATLLRLQGDLAATADDRRAIARRLLQIEREQVESLLREKIANERDPEQRAQLQGKLDRVPAEFELRGKALDRQNADPLQAYGQRLIDATSDTSEALKGIAADGFGALEDASSRAAAQTITDLLKIRGVAGDVINGVIQDLIRLAIQKAIVSAIGTSFFGLADGGPVDALRLAGGGPVFGAGGPRDDRIPAMLSNGEFVINAASTRRHRPLIEAINDNRLPRFADGGAVGMPAMPRFPSIDAARRAMQPAPTVRPIVFDLRGAITSADVLAEMQRIANETSGQVVREAAPAIVQAATNSTVAQLRRPAM